MNKMRSHIILLVSTLSLLAIKKNAQAQNEHLLPSEPALLEYGSAENPDPELPQQTPSLPSGNLLNDIIPATIKILLGIAGSLALIALTAGAFILITARGNEDQINTGKRIITWTVLAMILISISYAIIFGIASLEFTPPVE